MSTKKLLTLFSLGRIMFSKRTERGEKMKKQKEINLTSDPLENIKVMAPYLTEKQQYMALGMIMRLATENGDVKVKTA